MSSLPGPGRGEQTVVSIQDVRSRFEIDAATEARLQAIHERSFPAAERQLSMAYIVERAGQANSILRIVRAGRSAVGYAYLEISSEVEAAWLWYLAVEPEARNRGTGASLVGDTLASLRRERPSLRLMSLEVHRPPDDDAEHQVLDRRRIDFYRRLGANWIRGLDYRIPAADDPARSIAYDPMFFPLHEVVDDETVRTAILEMGRQSFLGSPDDPRWLGLVATVNRMEIIAPAEGASSSR